MSALYAKWILTALLGGISAGVAGYVLVALRLPFLGVALAHAALAGAVVGEAAGSMPLVWGGVSALLASALLGPAADRAGLSVNVLSGVLFSVGLGVLFLVIGLAEGIRSDLLGYLWGSLLLVQWADVIGLFGVAALLVALVVARGPVIWMVLFDREIARASGIPADAVYYALLACIGLAITVNLQTVGGLMLYALLVNPAAAAMLHVRRPAAGAVASGALAVLSAGGGLAVSLWLDWPAGASIVLVSSAIFLVAVITSGKQR